MPGRNQTLMRTRCPACSTVFRVTSDQLRAKAGKVRCGYCQAVFNAFDELLDETRPAAATQTLGEEQINLDAATTEYAPDEQADAIETAEPDEAVLIPIQRPSRRQTRRKRQLLRKPNPKSRWLARRSRFRTSTRMQYRRNPIPMPANRGKLTHPGR